MAHRLSFKTLPVASAKRSKELQKPIAEEEYASRCAVQARGFNANACVAGYLESMVNATRAGGRGFNVRSRIGSADDPLELEADRIAEQVTASRWPSPAGVTRAPQRIERSAAQAADSAPAVHTSVDQALRSTGGPLDASLRLDMEQRFGRDFSKVRVHRGEAAERSARDLNANAYTFGNDIVFGRGSFAPSTREGRRLIAHELTHVVQQTGGVVQPDIVQRQEVPAQGRKITLEEYKKLDPSLQVLTWGPDFINGFKRSGATTQIGDVAMAVLDKGFTQSADHPIMFRGGVMAGLPVGALSAVSSAIKSSGGAWMGCA